MAFRDCDCPVSRMLFAAAAIKGSNTTGSSWTRAGNSLAKLPMPYPPSTEGMLRNHRETRTRACCHHRQKTAILCVHVRSGKSKLQVLSQTMETQWRKNVGSTLQSGCPIEGSAADNRRCSFSLLRGAKNKDPNRARQKEFEIPIYPRLCKELPLNELSRAPREKAKDQCVASCRLGLDYLTHGEQAVSSCGC